MKIPLFLFLPWIMFCNITYSQSIEKQEISKNILYLELGTNFYVSSVSVNFERHFYSSSSEKVHLYGRAGIGGAAVYWTHAGWGGLGGLTMILGKGKHHFETSAGAFLGYESGTPYEKGTLFVLPLLDLGYRFQKPGKGFLFRAKAGILGIGVGLGYAF